MTLLPDDRCPATYRRDDKLFFCPISLADWLAACVRADVEHVPGHVVAVFERGDMLHHETLGPHQARLDAAYRKLTRAHRPDTMLRWDCCASGWLKSRMAHAEPIDGDDPGLHVLPLDARVLEIVYEWPRLLVPVLRRPWLRDKIAVADGYPVEYRVFVVDGQIQGISSYYPQRALRNRPAEVEAVGAATQDLIAAIKPPFQWPQPGRDQEARLAMVAGLTGEELAGPDPKGVHFTADFAITDDFSATDRRGCVFLEGGPPHHLGAHPCCFEGTTIKGVRLAL